MLGREHHTLLVLLLLLNFLHHLGMDFASCELEFLFEEYVQVVESKGLTDIRGALDQSGSGVLNELVAVEELK